MSRPVVVTPERLDGWLDRFAERHGPLTTTATDDTVTVVADDGETATIQVPFPPLTGRLHQHLVRPRRVGVLLVRLGGYATGVFEGTDLVVSKVGSRQVHGRSAAGGTSQLRFARRRDNQVKVALQAAADTAARVLLPHAPTLEAVVLGGDRSAVTTVIDDARLTALKALVQGPLIDVPDPKLVVLRATPDQFRSVRITVTPPGT